MAGEWKNVTIGEIATLQRGFDISQKEQRPGPVPVISSGGIASYHDEAKQAGPGVIMGRKGTLGSVYWIDKPYWPHSTSLWVKDFHGNDPKFVYYFFKAMGPELLRMDVGAANPTLNRNHVHPLPALRPPLPTQRAIAHVLGTLDDLIELNRETNAILEEMARALFKSWFVDFDPVRAKLEGRPPAGMDAATAALFPDHFQDSELGQIPRGWSVATLGSVLELAYGKPLKAEHRMGGDVGVYGSNGLVGSHNERLVAGPGIVVGRKGNPGIVTWAHGDFYPIDTAFYVVPTSGCKSLHFLYYALKLQDLDNLSADSAVPGLNRNHAYMSKQTIPPPPLLEAFDTQIAPVFDMIHANTEESRDLATLRDTLLPRLLSGEVGVTEFTGRMEARI